MSISDLEWLSVAGCESTVPYSVNEQLLLLQGVGGTQVEYKRSGRQSFNIYFSE